MRRLWGALLSSIDGLSWAARHEVAFMQELALLVIAVPAAFAVASAGWTRIALIGSILLVLMIELINTSLEKLCDHLAPEHSEAIKVVKDLGSAAVFVALALAGIVWLFAVAALAR